MGSRIPELHIVREGCGFVVVDEYGQYADSRYRTFSHTNYPDAEKARERLAADYLDNYDGPADDGEAWSGGFAGNH